VEGRRSAAAVKEASVALESQLRAEVERLSSAHDVLRAENSQLSSENRRLLTELEGVVEESGVESSAASQRIDSLQANLVAAERQLAEDQAAHLAAVAVMEQRHQDAEATAAALAQQVQTEQREEADALVEAHAKALSAAEVMVLLLRNTAHILRSFLKASVRVFSFHHYAQCTMQSAQCVVNS
jgi:hypothetical protein